MSERPKPDDVFRVIYPFVRDEYESFECEGPVRIKSWRPGISIEQSDEYGDHDCWAESEGEMILTVVDCHKPGRFPTRVFYTRRFIDPDGYEFGKGSLRICTLEKFRRIAAKYAVSYDVEETFGEALERRSSAVLHPVDGSEAAE